MTTGEGVFISVSVDESRIGLDTARALATACPVDIFGVEDGRLVIKPDQVDECTLCEVCLKVAPASALVIRKLYIDEQLVSRGSGSEHEQA